MIVNDYSHIKFENLPRIPASERLSLKQVAAVYFLIKDGEVVYIGSTKRLRNRINSTDHPLRKIGEDGVSIAWHEDHFLDVLEIENNFLRIFRPIGNLRIPKAPGPMKQSVYIEPTTKVRVQDMMAEYGLKNLDELINPALDALRREWRKK